MGFKPMEICEGLQVSFSDRGQKDLGVVCIVTCRKEVCTEEIRPDIRRNSSMVLPLGG